MSPAYCWMLQHLYRYEEDKGWQRSFLLYMLFYCRDRSPDIRVRGGDRVCKCQPQVHRITTLSTTQREKAADFSNDPYPFSIGKSVKPETSMDKPVPTCGKMNGEKETVWYWHDWAGAGAIRLCSLLQGPITWGSNHVRQFIFFKSPLCVVWPTVTVRVETNAFFYCGDCRPGYNQGKELSWDYLFSLPSLFPLPSAAPVWQFIPSGVNQSSPSQRKSEHKWWRNSADRRCGHRCHHIQLFPPRTSPSSVLASLAASSLVPGDRSHAHHAGINQGVCDTTMPGT